MREFIRHPSTVPIQLSEIDGDVLQGVNTLSNVSMGGISCQCDHPVDEGVPVTIKIDCVDPGFEISGVVIWCRQQQDGFEVGIKFLASKDKMFLLRMVEQICYIVMQNEKRELSSEQAAKEWIQKFAGEFPLA